jgi:WD40 repeat protein
MFLKIWDAATGKLLCSLRGDVDGGRYGAAVWSPNGRRLAASVFGDIEFVEIWDARRWNRIHLLERGPVNFYGTDGHYGVAWSPGGDQIASGNSRGEITVWDAVTGRQRIHSSGHSANVRSIAWSPDGRRIATGSEDRTVKVWNAATGDELLTLNSLDERYFPYSLAWSPDGRSLAAGGLVVQVWEAPSMPAARLSTPMRKADRAPAPIPRPGPETAR